MSSQPPPRTLFVGIGSPHGEDRIGWLVANALREAAPADIDIREAATPGDLLDWLEGIDRLVVCDACAVAPGTTSTDHGLHRWEWPTPEVATLRSANSHAFGLPHVLQLAEQLGTLPPVVIVFGVAAACFDAFAELSPRLAAAQDAIVQRITTDVWPVPAAGENGDHEQADRTASRRESIGRRNPPLREEDAHHA